MPVVSRHTLMTITCQVDASQVGACPVVSTCIRVATPDFTNVNEGAADLRSVDAGRHGE